MSATRRRGPSIDYEQLSSLVLDLRGKGLTIEEIAKRAYVTARTVAHCLASKGMIDQQKSESGRRGQAKRAAKEN